MKKAMMLMLASAILLACNNSKKNNDANAAEVVAESVPVLETNISENDFEPEIIEAPNDADDSGNSYYIATRNGQVVFESNDRDEIEAYKREQEEAKRTENSAKKNDWHNWESEDIRGFYVEIEDCNSDQEAESISDEYSDGTYISEYGRYFMPANFRTGEYEVEIEEKVSSRLFKLRSNDIFVYFKWSTNLGKYDEGVMDVWSNKGVFYIKPE